MIAGGGTGGHVLPALAVAQALVERGHDRSTIELVGSRRGQEEALLGGAGFPVTLWPGRGLVRRAGARGLWANARALAGLARATVGALAALRRWRPAVVVSVGGYASFPAGLAAVLLRIPLVLVNVDALPGLVHRVLGRFAAASAVAFPGTPLPRAVVTGSPVRGEITAVERSPEGAARARASLGLPVDRRTLAAFGGSLGARRINDAVCGLAGRWSDRDDVAVLQVTGRREFERLAGPARSGGAPAGLCHRLVPFVEQMDLLYASADLVVSRAGAMTVAELAAAGVPSVLVPLPGAPGDHQTANARALVEAGAAVLVPDAECDAARLDAVVGELLGDDARLQAMSVAARALGAPGAAERVAAIVEAQGSRGRSADEDPSGGRSSDRPPSGGRRG